MSSLAINHCENYFGAIAVTPESLKQIESACKNYLGLNSSLHWTIYSVGNKSIGLPNGASDFLQIRNPISERILSIEAIGRGQERKVFLEIGAASGYGTAALSVNVQGSVHHDANDFVLKIDEEVKNIKCWYSFLRKPVDSIPHWVENMPSWVPIAFAVLGLMLVGINLSSYGVSRLFPSAAVPSRTLYIPPEDMDRLSKLPVIDEGHTELQENEIASELESKPVRKHVDWLSRWRGLIFGVALLLFIVVWPRFFRLICPRVQFRIGEGESRYKHLVEVQLGIAILLVGSVLLPAVLPVLGWLVGW